MSYRGGWLAGYDVLDAKRLFPIAAWPRRKKDCGQGSGVAPQSDRERVREREMCVPGPFLVLVASTGPSVVRAWAAGATTNP
jgi:hypothetical protein